MAAFNGSQYIEQQVRSVLRQLTEQDELVIVDDASVDGTPALISSIRDVRVKLIEQAVNQGVVATFEQALRAATGEILFLCDDDDIWEATKVDRFVAAFCAHPKAAIVTSRVSFIDASSEPLQDRLYQNRPCFKKGFWANVAHNHFQGSAMAFRASLLPKILPFPRGVGFLHDHWIGTRNAITGGDVVYLDEPLLLYRRHGQNYSRRQSLAKQARLRVELLLTHMFRSDIILPAIRWGRKYSP